MGWIVKEAHEFVKKYIKVMSEQTFMSSKEMISVMNEGENV